MPIGCTHIKGTKRWSAVRHRLPAVGFVATLSVGLALVGSGRTAVADNSAFPLGIVATVGASGAVSVAVDPATHTVYEASADSDGRGSLSAIDESGDAHNGEITDTVPAGRFGDFPKVAVDPSTHRVFVLGEDASSPNATLSAVDESFGGHRGTITATTALAGNPRALAVDPSTHHVYVLSGAAGSPDTTLSVIDGSGDADAGTVTATTVLAGTVHNLPPAPASPLAVDPSSHNVYVGLDGNVSVIDESGDANTGTVTATIPVDDHTLTGITVDPSTRDVYVSGNTIGTSDVGFVGHLSVIDESGDIRTGRVTSNFDYGGGVAPVALDPSTEDVYVGAYGNILDIDESNDIDSGNPVSHGVAVNDPYSMAVDPINHNVYVADGQSGALLVLNRHNIPPNLTLYVGGVRSAADGSILHERVTVTDNSPTPASDVTTELLLPAGVTVISAPGASGTNPLVWTQASIGPEGSEVSYVIAVRVGADVQGPEYFGGVTVSAVNDADPIDNVAIFPVHLG